MARNNEAKIKFTAETSEFNSQIKAANSELQELRSELKLNETQMKGAGNSAQFLKDKQAILQKELAAAQDKTAALNEKLKVAEELYGENSEEAKKLRTQLNNAQNAEQAIKNEIEKTNQELKNQKTKLQEAGEKVGEYGDKLTSAGKKASKVSAAIVGVGVAAGKTAMDFEESMAKVNTIAEDTDVKLNGSTMSMESAILELSSETGTAATDIAESVYSAISAGQKTEDAVEFVQTASKLAAGGFTQSANAVDILTTILNAYGMEATEAGKVSDMLIQTQNKGKTTVAELSSSMGKIIPTANSMNVSLDQLCAGYSIMTAKGIATAESTTYMNSMLNELGKSGTKVSDAIKAKTGKSFQDLMKDGKSLGDVLQILKVYAEENKLGFNDLWGSAEAGKAGLTLLSGGVTAFNTAVKDMNDSLGATDAAFETVSGTKAHQLKESLNQVKNTGIDLGTTLLTTLTPAFDTVSNKVQTFSNWFSGLNENQKKGILVIAGVVAAIGPALLIFGKAATAISSIIQVVNVLRQSTLLATIATKLQAVAQAILNAVMSANPVALVVIAIVALIAIFVVLWNKCEGFRNFFIKLWENIKKVVSKAVDSFSKSFNSLKEKVTTTIESIRSTVSAKFNAVKTAILTPIENARDKVREIIEKIKGFFNFKASIPHIKMPHFEVTPKGWKIADLLQGTIPKLKINWYAQGGVFTKPTVLSGFGEAGTEYALPLNEHSLSPLASMLNRLQIKNEMQSNNEQILLALYKEQRNMSASLGNIIASALDNASLDVNGREFGRLVKKYG